MTKQAKLKKQAYTSTLKSRALSVLIYLIDRSNKELTCFPSIPTVAEQLHISVSTVKRALRELEDFGYIKKAARFREKNKGQTSNLYTLVLFECQPISDESDELELEEYEEHVKTMEVETVEVLQENKENRQKYQVEHINFGMIKAQREETRECQGKILLQKYDINDSRKEATDSQWWRISFRSCQNVTSYIPDQYVGHSSIRKSGTGKTSLHSWMGEGVSLIPP